MSADRLHEWSNGLGFQYILTTPEDKNEEVWFSSINFGKKLKTSSSGKSREKSETTFVYTVSRNLTTNIREATPEEGEYILGEIRCNNPESPLVKKLENSLI